MCRMPPDGRRAITGGRGLLRQTALGTRLATATSTRPRHRFPAANVRAVASFVCARAHRASALLRRPADPGPSCLALSLQGGTRGGRLTAGELGRREAHSLQRDNPSPVPARRFAAGPCGRWAITRRTARHPWRAASTNLQCDTQLGRLSDPSPWASPLPRSTRRDAQGWDERRVVAHCRRYGPQAAAPSRLRVVRVQRRRVPFPTPGGPGRLELAQTLGDLLFGGAELIEYGHASPCERVHIVLSRRREDLHNFGDRACSQSLGRLICRVGTADVHGLSRRMRTQGDRGWLRRAHGAGVQAAEDGQNRGPGSLASLKATERCGRPVALAPVGPIEVEEAENHGIHPGTDSRVDRTGG